MTKRQKLIKKIKSAKTADFGDINQLLRQLGFSCRVSGSHHTYVKDTHIIVIAVHGKQLKRVYLRNVQDLLEEMGL